jgi:hypothetical protein
MKIIMIIIFLKLQIIFNLAMFYKKLENFNDAKSLLLEYLNGRKLLLGDDHPDTVEVNN